MKFKARVWKFGDNINTDLILPIQAFYLNAQEQTRHVFSANRPGWVDEVQPGDILIGGKNFGMGSSRPGRAFAQESGLKLSRRAVDQRAVFSQLHQLRVSGARMPRRVRRI